MEKAAKVVAWAGGAIFVATYLVLLILQFAHLDVTEMEWTRRIELLNPIQSLAFAGAGALLGTAVQSQATNKVQEIADKNQDASDKAHELAGAVKHIDDSEGATPAAVQALIPLAEEIVTK